MKKAVIFIGHVRSFKKNYDDFRKIYKSADFYFHAIDKGDNNESEDLEKISKTDKKFFYDFFQDVEDSYVSEFDNAMSIFSFPTFNKIKKTPTGYSPTRWIKQVVDYNRAFTWFESFNKQYDLVIRIRPDLRFIRCNIKYEKIEKGKLYCFEQKTYRNQVNDKFFFGSQKIMRTIMKNYSEYLKKINYKSSKLNAEELLYSYLISSNIPFEFLDTKNVYLKKNKDNELQCAGFRKK